MESDVQNVAVTTHLIYLHPTRQRYRCQLEMTKAQSYAQEVDSVLVLVGTKWKETDEQKLRRGFDERTRREMNVGR